MNHEDRIRRAARATTLALICWLGVGEATHAAAVPFQGRGARRAVEGPPAQSEVDAAVARGVAYLRGVHAREGGFGPVRRFGEEALALYALVKSGVPLEDPLVRDTLAHLVANPTVATYDLGVGLLLLRALGDAAPLTWMQLLLETLVGTQNNEGDWGYPGGADLSNTQYAALGLWAAAECGLEVAPRVWRDLERGVDLYRGSKGGHGYSRGTGGGTGTMTAAAVATYALLEGRLAEWDGNGGKRRRAAVQDGLRWLGERFDPADNPGGAWTYYWLYGVERVGAFASVAQLGEHDWYGEGARFLVDDQREDGRWGGGVVDTAFALLFLRRASAGTPTTGRSKVPSYRTLEADAPFRIVASGTDELALWVTGWNEEVLADLLWEGERTPHVLRVEWLVDERVVDLKLGEGDAPCGDERYATRATFRSDGPVRVRARAHLQGPQRQGPGGRPWPGEVRMVETPLLEAEVSGVPDPWPRERLELFARGRAGEGVEARSDSVHCPEGGPRTSPHAAAHAVDGNDQTAWLARPGDEGATLVIDLGPGRELHGLALLQPVSLPYRPGATGRLLDVQVRLDREAPQRVRFHADPRRAGIWTLERPRHVRRIEITLGPGVPGSESPFLGLSEVLLLR